MNLADSFYIALCMTVLLLGVVYWFWTQTQYLQRKMNLLENIVYELKTLIDRGPSESPVGPSAVGPSVAADAAVSSEPPSYPPPPGSEFGEDDDLLHEQLHTTTQKPVSSESSAPTGASDELQPGGVGSGLASAEADVPFSESTKPKGNVLDGMTLKELRRLAEQRGVAGASTMRKQALIDALRSDVSRVEEGPSSEGSLTVPVVESKSPITMSDETTLNLQ
jgi:hypothetical protein